MIIIPVNNYLRNKIISWLEKGKTYVEIIELVKNEGGTITGGGITYIKKKHITKQKDETKQKNTKQTKQTKQKKAQANKPNFETDLRERELKESKENKYVKLLSGLEFKNFENCLKIVINSNLIRLKSANAHGILNALLILEDTCKMIKKRGKYQ